MPWVSGNGVERQSRTDLTEGGVEVVRGRGRTGAERRGECQYGCQNEERCSTMAMTENPGVATVVVVGEMVDCGLSELVGTREMQRSSRRLESQFGASR
jgi:hypothetical protein